MLRILLCSPFVFRPLTILCCCLGLICFFAWIPLKIAAAQQKRDKSNQAIIKGSVEFDSQRSKSWDGAELIVPLDQFTTKLFEQVPLPRAPLPDNWNELTTKERGEWIQEFEASEEGKEFLAERQRRIAAAKSFDVLIEADGKFVVYDVPVGIYGIGGEIEKEINNTLYSFEVFGQLEVRPGMDEIRLNPIQVAVTPLLKAGQSAPPFQLNSLVSSNSIQLTDFTGKYLLVSFWMANSPAADYQKVVQDAAAELQAKYPMELLSVSVDDKAEDAKRVIEQYNLNAGIHGFAGSFDHAMLFDYGVRSLPTLWLIDPQGKISLSQIDFAIALGQELDLKVTITDRIEGKEPPSVIAEREAQSQSQSVQEDK